MNSLIVVVLLLLCFAGQVNAEEQGLGITSRVNITAKPGEPFQGEVRLRNITSTPVAAAIALTDYAPGNLRNATPFLELATTTQHLGPYAVRYITFRGTIPATAPAGGYYAYLTATTANPDPHVAVRGQVASLIAITVPGTAALREELKITGSGLRTLHFAYPIQSEIVVENTGDIHLDTVGQMILDPVLGAGGVQVGESPRQTIIPGEKTALATEIKQGPPLGLYKRSIRACWGPGRCAERDGGFVAVITGGALLKLLLVLLILLAAKKYLMPPNRGTPVIK